MKPKHRRLLTKLQRIRIDIKEYKTASILRKIMLWYRLNARSTPNPSRCGWYVLRNRGKKSKHSLRNR